MSRFRFPIVLLGAMIVCASVLVPAASASFAVTAFSNAATNENGTTDVQAGSHPFALTTSMSFATRTNGEGALETEGNVKDIVVKLPPGLVGDMNAVPQCGENELEKDEPVLGHPEACSDITQVGTIVLDLAVGSAGFEYGPTPVYNMVPPKGAATEFGFNLGAPYHIIFSVRTGEDYGITATSTDVSQGLPLAGLTLTTWGVPASPAHNATRGEPLKGDCSEGFGTYGECPVSLPPTPFVTLPTQCKSPLTSTIEADAWLEMGDWQRTSPYESQNSEGEPVPLTGCEKLDFSPSIRVRPDTTDSSTPAGLTTEVRMPQFNEGNAQVAESNLRKTVVRLPTGVSLSPSAADGLAACPLEGPQGINLKADSPPGCPDASKIGTVQVETPLLKNRLEGSVYLAEQEHNPFGRMFALYLAFEDPYSGVIVKVAGEVTADPNTGQLTAVFDETPQLPFEDFKIHFFGGPRSPLTTPVACGTYTTETEMESWGGQTVTPSSSFTIDSGPGGGPCPGASLPFNPSLTAGTTNINAGGFSPLTMTMSREDGDQQLNAIELKTPSGLSGLLSGVELCPEPQAGEGLCGPGSLIGETTISVGLGNDPFTVTGGKVYITGPYEGAPFGLSIVNPAKAGPFDLENTKASKPPCDCVLVRAKVEVNPITAALTVTSNTAAQGDSIPTMLEGIPLQIKHVNVTINRPNFTFNPTNCNPTSITGSLHSAEGAVDALSVPFQATNCAVLGFKPGFTVSTSGKTSRANGASLSVKLSYPKAPFGSQANIKSVKVDLPKQLPSRLTTLQKACPAKTFETNPAGCQAASIVGHGTAITPLVPVPLAGPAYFVSYGGAKFPELVVVLQGYGVTIDLHGETFISKAGITSSTFRTIPDQPVGSFELTLPQGPSSALAANGNLCKSKLAMPTAFTAQNGMEIHESTKISVTGCPKAVHKGKKAKDKNRKHKPKK